MALQYQYMYAITIDLFDGSLLNIQAGATAGTYYVQEGTGADGDGYLETNTLDLFTPAENVGLSTDGVTYSDAGTYVGQTVSGGIVYEDGFGDLFLLSNSGTLTGNIGLTVLPTEICFATGTLIATPTGERRVEELTAGDLVSTADGRAVPVKWIGHQTVTRLFTPSERRTPVRFLAGSLGDGLPHSDLVVTSDHAMMIDGIAIQAGALVNGITILRDAEAAKAERATYYHIETACHDIVLANGAPAETFVDHVSRKHFDNFAEYVTLFGSEEPVVEMDYPRAMSPRQIPARIRQRFGLAQAA